MSRSLTPVNRVGVDERAAALGRRSIKTTAKREGIKLATSMIDLTTLEGSDTPGKVRHLCAKAVCPDPSRPEIPSVAAVCVYPALVGVAAEALRGSGVAVASVATGFPAGQTSLAVKVEETREAVAAGANEIDMVISREAYLSGDDARVAHEIQAVAPHGLILGCEIVAPEQRRANAWRFQMAFGQESRKFLAAVEQDFS